MLMIFVSATARWIAKKSGLYCKVLLSFWWNKEIDYKEAIFYASVYKWLTIIAQVKWLKSEVVLM